MSGPNNEATVASFLHSLCKELDNDFPDWKRTHVLMLDNCTSHKTKLVKNVMEAAGFTVIFTAPASYLVAPVEGIFALIKSLNLDQITTPSLPIVKEKGFR